jgi:hypothetical protein
MGELFNHETLTATIGELRTKISGEFKLMNSSKFIISNVRGKIFGLNTNTWVVNSIGTMVTMVNIVAK